MLCAALGAAWWSAKGPLDADRAAATASRDVARGAAAPVSGSQPASTAWAWGQPSPFGPGPVATTPEITAAAFAIEVQQFAILRAQVAQRPQPDLELMQLADALRADLPQRLHSGDLSAAEALLLAGAALEIIEPNPDARAAELAEFAARNVPAVADESG